MLRFLTYETDSLDEMMCLFDEKAELNMKIEFWDFDDVILLRKIDLAFVQIIRSLFKMMMKQNIFEKRFKYQKNFEKLYDETNS